MNWDYYKHIFMTGAAYAGGYLAAYLVAEGINRAANHYFNKKKN